ncbi:uncharacterized protein NEMAJ01_0243 [Nematocida major]|uniref:uncharacterized protein n=1 Tax=Nematocida major TaxID=1912982 RepID=UPI002008405F|nr:uncharacterized protein NEMAJ01_0243 [Nematocida major]KAH9385347.1 hypothetical protein NEMAJ01_0243 [Nematocida major]
MRKLMEEKSSEVLIRSCGICARIDIGRALREHNAFVRGPLSCAAESMEGQEYPEFCYAFDRSIKAAPEGDTCWPESKTELVCQMLKTHMFFTLKFPQTANIAAFSEAFFGNFTEAKPKKSDRMFQKKHSIQKKVIQENLQERICNGEETLRKNLEDALGRIVWEIGLAEKACGASAASYLHYMRLHVRDYDGYVKLARSHNLATLLEKICREHEESHSVGAGTDIYTLGELYEPLDGLDTRLCSGLSAVKDLYLYQAKGREDVRNIIRNISGDHVKLIRSLVYHRSEILQERKFYFQLLGMHRKVAGSAFVQDGFAATGSLVFGNAVDQDLLDALVKGPEEKHAAVRKEMQSIDAKIRAASMAIARVKDQEVSAPLGTEGLYAAEIERVKRYQGALIKSAYEKENILCAIDIFKQLAAAQKAHILASVSAYSKILGAEHQAFQQLPELEVPLAHSTAGDCLLEPSISIIQPLVDREPSEYALKGVVEQVQARRRRVKTALVVATAASFAASFLLLWHKAYALEKAAMCCAAGRSAMERAAEACRRLGDWRQWADAKKTLWIQRA